jgi:hypothetical protein
MGLALPLALLGLLAVGIPLWLHRVRRRLLREQPLPTLLLLSRAVAKKRRTLTFRDRPLLYARIALVALFALALARPFLSQIASYATERPIALSIVLDDSMSMERRGRRFSTLFEAAVSRARAVTGELAPESEVAVVLAGSAPRVLVRRTTDVDVARAALASLERTGARGTALSEAVAQAARELSGSKLATRELLVLTDCARHSRAKTLDTAALALRVECMPVRDKEQNAFIRGLALGRARDADGARRLNVALGASAGLESVDVVVTVDDKRVAEDSVRFERGEGTLEVKVPQETLSAGRTLAAKLLLEDAIRSDNVRQLSLTRSSDISVLLVDGDPSVNQRDDELRYLSLALSLGDATHPPPRVVRVDADGLGSADLDAADVIVLANVPAPSETDAKRLADRVKRGAGLLISGGDQVDPFAYRGRFGELLPTLLRSAAQAQPALGVSQPEAAPDPALLPEAGLGLETGRTAERLLVESPTGEARTLMTFTDGTPLLISGRFGSGRTALFTTTLDDDWTDLPLTPGFVPLLHGLVRGLSAVDALPPGPHPAGSVLTARVPPGADSLFMLTPDGRRVDLELKEGRVRMASTAEVGVYRTYASSTVRGEHELPQLSFTIVPDADESDIVLGAPPKAEKRGRNTGVGRPKSVDNWMWLAFGLAFLAEGVMRRFARRKTSAESLA